MPLTAAQAATIAHRHGLSLQDAAALRALADDETSADKIARQFAPGNDAPDPDMIGFTRGLFAASTDD